MKNPQQPLRIAIADDEPDTLRFLQGALQRLGHEVVVAAADGRDLVGACKTARPDLVVTDIKMPDMDGLEAARQIYAELPLPIIVVSAYHDPQYIEQAMNSHVAAFLVKPIKASHLAPAIAVVMRRFAEFREASREAEDLRQALEDRKLIERAKGILMKEARLDEESAFRRLQKLASRRSQKLAVAARMIIDTADVMKIEEETGRD